jgi:hypothetical protein
MNDIDELAFWSHLYFEMCQVPNELRTQNHTAYLGEIERRMYDLQLTIQA